MQITRRSALCLTLLGGLTGVSRTGFAQGSDATDMPARFIAEAERMRRQAVAAGDQSYGAVLVKGGVIVGWGPSEVVKRRNPNAHAERVAVWDAQQRLGTQDLGGSVLYSTSLPCSACQAEAARWGVARMFWGAGARDGGAPRPG